jgi:protein TonB
LGSRDSSRNDAGVKNDKQDASAESYVTDEAIQKEKTNWLLVGLIAVSLLFHAGLFFHSSGKFIFKRPSYIEISVLNDVKPQARDIPRPQVHQKKSAPRQFQPDIQSDILRSEMAPAYKNANEIIAPAPVQPASEEYIPKDMKLDIHEFSLPEIATTGGFGSRMDYLDMVRLKIESRKEYPKSSQQRNIEGKVVVEFVISANGSVSALKVVNGSGDKDLDQAAILAVQKAAPFSSPPGKFFNGPVRVKVQIMFELLR